MPTEMVSLSANNIANSGSQTQADFAKDQTMEMSHQTSICMPHTSNEGCMEIHAQG